MMIMQIVNKTVLGSWAKRVSGQAKRWRQDATTGDWPGSQEEGRGRLVDAPGDQVDL